MTEHPSARMKEEIAALWTATFGELPAIEADPETMLQVLVACLQDVGPWRLDTSGAQCADAPDRRTVREPALAHTRRVEPARRSVEHA